MLHFENDELFLAIPEFRKEEILKTTSTEQHIALWLDLIKLMIYAYPDPFIESAYPKLRWCFEDLMTTTVLPVLSLVEWDQLEDGDFTTSQLLFQPLTIGQRSQPFHKLLALLPQWTGVPRLRGLLRILINSDAFSQLERFSLEYLIRTQFSRVQYEGHIPSTFEKVSNVVIYGKLGKVESMEPPALERIDVYVQFALAFELMRRKRFVEAYSQWHEVVGKLQCGHEHLAIEYIPAVVELIKSCIFINQEAEGEVIALKNLALYASSTNKEQMTSMHIALADCLIGQRKYKGAEVELNRILKEGHLSAPTRSVVILRLNKVKRRLGTLSTLEAFAALDHIEDGVYDPHRAAAIIDEYLDELSATLNCPASRQILQTVPASSMSIIQEMTLRPRAQIDRSTLAKIALHANKSTLTTLDKASDESFDGITQGFSLSTRPDALDKLQSVSQDLSREGRRQLDCSSSGDTTASPSARTTDSHLAEPTVEESLREEVRLLQQTFRHRLNQNSQPTRLPKTEDFPESYSAQVLLSDSKLNPTYVMLLFYSDHNSFEQLKTLAYNMLEQQPGATFVLLKCPAADRRPPRVPSANIVYDDLDDPLQTIKRILEDIIRLPLMLKCGFSPGDIVLLGYGKAGTLALHTALVCQDVEFGAAISLSGPLPSFMTDTVVPPDIKSETPILFIASPRSFGINTTCTTLQKHFQEIQVISSTTTTLTKEVNASMLDRIALGINNFLSHRLRNEKWSRQAILSLGNSLSYPGCEILMRFRRWRS
ncbi:MAG: hypothetical protein Q9219_006190 [cf. Caloplaca sp. 3 TL-2023]